MCRHAYIPPLSELPLKHRPTQTQLKNLFEYLEKRGGGDGNGVAIHTKTEIITHKGLNLTAADCAEAIHSHPNCRALFHTRIASVGPKHDTLCHPFIVQTQAGHQLAITHNGTWLGGTALARILQKENKQHFNDSRAFAHLVARHGWKWVTHTLDPSGVYLSIGHYALAYKSSYAGDLAYHPNTRIWASCFPHHDPIWNDHYEAKHGTHPLRKPAPRAYSPHFNKHHTYTYPTHYHTPPAPRTHHWQRCNHCTRWIPHNEICVCSQANRYTQIDPGYSFWEQPE